MSYTDLTVPIPPLEIELDMEDRMSEERTLPLLSVPLEDITTDSSVVPGKRRRLSETGHYPKHVTFCPMTYDYVRRGRWKAPRRIESH